MSSLPRVRAAQRRSVGRVAALATAFTLALVPLVGATPAVADEQPDGGDVTVVEPTGDPTPEATPTQDPTPTTDPTGDPTPEATPTEDPTPAEDPTPTADPTGAPADLSFTVAAVPAVAGDARVGATLTADPGVWEPAAAFTYQWFRVVPSQTEADAVELVAIDGATAAEYVPTPTDLGNPLVVAVTGTATGVLAQTVQSAPTAPVAAGVIVPGAPTISGTAQVGVTLTAKPGTWSPSPSLAYQWYRAGTAIAGATKSTYVPTSTDVSKQLTVTVTGTKTGYAKVSKTSAKTAAVKLGVLTAPTPTLPSTVRVATKAAVSTGSWTSETTLRYQWYIGGKAVTGTRGTASTLTPAAAELGKSVLVKVTGSKSGYTTVTKTSATKKIAAGAFSAPAPKITGTLRVGQTLSASRGTWSPAATTYGYQWRANGTAISGATKSTFTLTSAQRGKAITVTVTGHRTACSTKSVTSAATAKVVQSFVKSPVPTISGTARVGSTLKVNRGTWSPTPSFTQQWKRNGAAISGATGTSYKLTAADQGKTITVTVTAKASYWVTTSRTSTRTATIAAAPLTALQTQAVSMAKDYLQYMPFSRAGLIDQLVWEGFSQSDATVGADRSGANWNAQAVLMAKESLQDSPLSRSGLIDLLVYEGFTEAQAEYGVANSGANWNTQAVLMAKEYLQYSSFSRSSLIDQLLYEGFTEAQAEYAATQVGLTATSSGSTPATGSVTVAQQQALTSANSYLAILAFSRSGLIDQLEYDGFSTADATYGVDHVDADWNDQAAREAQAYLDIFSFSRSGLIAQLVFDGFTQAQAEYGVTQAGL